MGVPYEDVEQGVLADWLDRRGLVWEFTPMDGTRTKGSGSRVRRLGAKRGSSDNKIFNPVPGRPWIRGVAIELKRQQGGKESPQQEARRHRMTACGWLCIVSPGAEHAITSLIALGF